MRRTRLSVGWLVLGIAVIGSPVIPEPNAASSTAGFGRMEADDASPLPIDIGDTWTYFKGTAEPSTPVQVPPIWALAGFDDSSWLSGPEGSATAFPARIVRRSEARR